MCLCELFAFTCLFVCCCFLNAWTHRKTSGSSSALRSLGAGATTGSEEARGSRNTSGTLEVTGVRERSDPGQRSTPTHIRHWNHTS
jgi:hypothetical protein